MARKTVRVQSPKRKRPKRVILSAEESLKRMNEFGKRKETFIASIRKGTN